MDFIANDFQHGKNFNIGHRCIIEEDVIVGDNVTIGHNCIIMSGCEIGDNTRIEHNVLLKKGTIIGNDCYVDSYFKSSGDNKIGNGVILRFNSTIARQVTVEDGVFISPNVMTIFSNHKGNKHPGIVIGKNSHIGTGSVINAGVKIVPETVVGAMSLVTKDIDKPGIYVGIPAKYIKEV